MDSQFVFPSEYLCEVEAEPLYLEAYSSPESCKYVFAYTIRILNTGEHPVKLLSRYWQIMDANGEVQEVSGEGVVGQQPVLEPGEGFEYTSSAVISTPVGTMQGSYKMIADDGTPFETEIPAFHLQMPRILH
ncbi:MAG: Co2+/Mg2+ efflux protein ApaG [Betaproteobacteria bacterium TMED82]|nr:MAG: Co2+/Mg2+ efflux protein ApaG [Betaproteobacteria bacterium TMED82]|tara:strand:- start:10891 stop:11286 length:396 start_codon:yes stop_codon:yes gene_type:complete